MNILRLNLLGILTLVFWVYAWSVSRGIDAQASFGWTGIVSLMVLFLLVRLDGIRKFKTRPLYLLAILFSVGGLAEGAIGLGQWIERPQYVSVARIITDTPGDEGAIFSATFFYTLNNEILSPAVLADVITATDVTAKWSQKYGNGRSLSTDEIEARLRQQLQVKPVRGTRLTAITARSSDPAEAARLANATANALIKHREELKNQIAELIRQPWRYQSTKDYWLAVKISGHWTEADWQKTYADWKPPGLDIKIVDVARPEAEPDNLTDHQEGMWRLAGGLITAMVGALIFRTKPSSPEMS